MYLLVDPLGINFMPGHFFSLIHISRLLYAVVQNTLVNAHEEIVVAEQSMTKEKPNEKSLLTPKASYNWQRFVEKW